MQISIAPVIPPADNRVRPAKSIIKLFVRFLYHTADVDGKHARMQRGSNAFNRVCLSVFFSNECEVTECITTILRALKVTIGHEVLHLRLY